MIFYQDYGPLTFSIPLSKLFLLVFSILLLAVCNILFQLTVLVSIQYYNTILERNGQGDYREISPKYRFGFILTRKSRGGTNLIHTDWNLGFPSNSNLKTFIFFTTTLLFPFAAISLIDMALLRLISPIRLLESRIINFFYFFCTCNSR